MRNALLAIAAVAILDCGNADEARPPAASGPAVSQYEYTAAVTAGADALLVLVIDDRPLPQSAELRSGVGAAMRALGLNAVGNAYAVNPDRASWHPVDLDVIIVPASDPSATSIASVATDAALGWTTVQATKEGADALAQAVDAHVTSLTAPDGGPFRPLQRAREMLQLVTSSRPPMGQAEERTIAVLGARASRRVGVTIVAASDDEGDDPPQSYWDGTPAGDALAGLATTVGSAIIGSQAGTFPRLAAWAEGRFGSPIDGCYESSAASFLLFQPTCIDHRFPCDGRPIEQTTPGLGSCQIEVAAWEPDRCTRSRGWLDPLDTDGVRRPRQTAEGARVCEVQPVAPEAMDRCVASADCVDCGSGWCVTTILDQTALCSPGSMARPIRWVGGALPDQGTVHVRCREQNR